MLIEIMIAVFITSLFFPQLYSMFNSAVKRQIQLYDSRIAMQRLNAVQTLIKLPIFYCGYGMPYNVNLYRSAFGSVDVEPFSWQGPISVSSHNGKNNALLKIAYAKREKQYIPIKQNYNGKNSIIQLNAPISTRDITASTAQIPLSVKNYIIFAGSSKQSAPLCVRKISGKSITVESKLHQNFAIPMYDVLHLFCAMKIYAENGILYSYDYKTSGNQPRVKGIQDIRFYLQDNIITVYVLAEGNIKREGNSLKLVDFEENDTNTALLQEWKNSNCINSLYASKTVWSLPNCLRENVLENIAE